MPVNRTGRGAAPPAPVDHAGSGGVARTPVRFRIQDMDCPSCVARIESHLNGVDGVVAVHGDVVARSLTVEMDPVRTDAERVQSEIGRLGYLAQPVAGATPTLAPSTWTSAEARVAYAAIALFLLGWLLEALGGGPTLLRWLGEPVGVAELLWTAAALVGGTAFFPKALGALRTRSLDMNFLMTIAILGAIGIGEFSEAAAIAFLFSIAELLERHSLDRARASVESLMRLSPQTARVLREGVESVVPADAVTTGDAVLVRPGERVPVDGQVAEGASAINQAPITGEPLPVDKGIGDEVFAGTINGDGFLRVTAAGPATHSTLARIVELVESASRRKARSERFVERFARIYTPLVTVAAVLVVAVPTLLLGADFGTWFLRGLTLLVIACPCALVISTPVAVVSGITAAARNGVLIKGGAYLEAVGAVRALAFDKTGTLTHGHPEVVAIEPAAGAEERDVLARAAALEARARHPIARAIVEAAERRGVHGHWSVTDFESTPGVGVRARLDGVAHAVGRGAGSDADTARRNGDGSVVTVERDGQVLGWIRVADRTRDAAARTLADLKASGVEHIALLTGDHEGAATALARTLGVDEVRADLLPEDKLRAIDALEERFGVVAMVGDGVNDAPALARATVGIAMGVAGSDTALETADVALMGDDLDRLPYLLTLSRRARRVIRQNVATAIVVKAILVVGVPLGWVSLIAAVVLGDLGVSLAVTLNALRLGRES
ncbi:MAG: cation-translocating P-type ATPase [Gemmatimonadota bacterium]|nr:cadmium-translocating P-type ATPase [Gemmatimonadota bacterium]